MNTLKKIKEAQEDVTVRVHPESLGQSLRVRVPECQVTRLDRIINYCEDRGVYDVTRSSIIRDAIEIYLDLVEKEFPEVLE